MDRTEIVKHGRNCSSLLSSLRLDFIDTFLNAIQYSKKNEKSFIACHKKAQYDECPKERVVDEKGNVNDHLKSVCLKGI